MAKRRTRASARQADAPGQQPDPARVRAVVSAAAQAAPDLDAADLHHVCAYALGWGDPSVRSLPPPELPPRAQRAHGLALLRVAVALGLDVAAVAAPEARAWPRYVAWTDDVLLPALAGATDSRSASVARAWAAAWNVAAPGCAWFPGTLARLPRGVDVSEVAAEVLAAGKAAHSMVVTADAMDLTRAAKREAVRRARGLTHRGPRDPADSGRRKWRPAAGIGHAVPEGYDVSGREPDPVAVVAAPLRRGVDTVRRRRLADILRGLRVGATPALRAVLRWVRRLRRDPEAPDLATVARAAGVEAGTAQRAWNRALRVFLVALAG